MFKLISSFTVKGSGGNVTTIAVRRKVGTKTGDDILGIIGVIHSLTHSPTHSLITSLFTLCILVLY